MHSVPVLPVAVDRHPLAGIEGNANIWGSLWTDDINLVVQGNAFVYYSTQGLALANTIMNGGGSLPTPLKVSALIDCAQVPAGANGCPS